ncbi:hypothetical protein CWI75_11245 [Kineobactrum sediminis]|uniref:DUF4345 domain-containing protein n=1 Tax=Kineobactrum sediminis TaxID=1905677 RepID=A0A2N5Y1R2_9GAMM|nr:hypothetical protein [Kineobactrum sediminis]PLW82335.1 hypothetical protein CWI75_11245 [Kineobactrum sediminis]
MTTTLRVFSALLGVIFTAIFLLWLLEPGRAAEALGMPLLEGVARNTQVGDFTAFFFALAAFIGLGVVRQQPTWLWSASLVLGAAAVFRLSAAAMHDATLVLSSVIIEGVGAAILLAYASRLERR